MRTTLSLDDDVAAMLNRLRSARKLGLKEAVNTALRLGLRQMAEPSVPRPRYQTPSVDLGRCRIGSLDDVAEALAAAEDEGFR
jgi:hypothetical protein